MSTAEGKVFALRKKLLRFLCGREKADSEQKNAGALHERQYTGA